MAVNNPYNVDPNLWGKMSQQDMASFNTAMGGAGGGGGASGGRDQLAGIMGGQQQQQALSGGAIQYSTPTAPTGVAPQPGNADIPADLLARMSPTDIALFRKASSGQAIPTGVAGPYGGGAMGLPQINSSYNAFSGAGLPPTNIGKGGLYGGGYGGSEFFGGGSPVGGGGGSPTRVNVGQTQPNAFDVYGPNQSIYNPTGQSTGDMTRYLPATSDANNPWGVMGYPGYGTDGPDSFGRGAGPLPSYMNPNPGS